MFNPSPKPEPREKKPRQQLRSHSHLKSKPDPIPDKIKDEVDERDGRICQRCGRYFPYRVPGLYHHIRNRAHRYEPMVRFWQCINGVWDWIMVPVWFEFHSKENLITLCPPPYGECHTLADGVEKKRWEQVRDSKYRMGECERI